MFRFSNNYSDYFYDEIKNIVNEILDEEAPEDQIEELTKTVSLIFKEYVRTLISQSTISNQNSLINIYQPTFTNIFNSYSPFYQPILSSLHLQSIPKRKNKLNNKNKPQINMNRNSVFSMKPTQSVNQPCLSSNPKQTSKSPHFTKYFIQNKQQIQNKCDGNDSYQSDQSNNEEQTQSTQLNRKEKKENYEKYIFKVLKQFNPDHGTFNNTMLKNNSFITDIFERVTQKSSKFVDTS